MIGTSPRRPSYTAALLEAPPNLKRWLQILGWACYLACSWTWCIGMFLPVLLVRDYGVWGFVVFAVPNVVGAAAMGWVVSSPTASQSLLVAHTKAVLLFSFTTIVFQIFFYTMPGPTKGPWAAILLAPVVMITLVVMAAKSWRLILVPASLLVYAVSISAVIMNWQEGAKVPSYTDPKLSLFPISLVCAFGFLLCPYLDGTFHRARKALSGRAARAAFTIGFGVFFLIMILFTLSYAEWMPTFLNARGTERIITLGQALILTHISVQLSYTAGVHVVELSAGSGRLRIPVVAVTVLVCGMMLWYIRHTGFQAIYHGMRIDELIYRVFMSFYGLVFPAYVWLCMIPTWRDPRPPTTRHIAVWIGACVLAAPCYWMGFIERVEWWLIPGLAVVLLARLLIPPVSRGSTPPPAEPSPALVPVHSGPSELSEAATPER